MKKSTFLIFLACLALRTLATNYYVSPFGNDNSDGQASSTALRSIQKAANLAVAGDTVLVMNGTYNSTSGPILNITSSGNTKGYITFKAMPGHSPKITASGNVWNAVSINGSYIVFDGFELIGNNANITYEKAFASYTEAANGGKNWSVYANYNTNGISIGGPRDETKFPHHVIIRNCKVHDFPGGGISSIQADYTTIENNVVYNNAWYMMYGGSGISILNPFNSDKTTGYKNTIRNNICCTNKTTIPWISLKRLSDGNGIIIDVNQRPYGAKAGEGEPYGGRTLVENNVSFNNGGSGIHTYLADHVDIINNTAYHNGTVVSYPDIFTNQCQDVNIINNIMYAREGGDCNSKPKFASEVYSNNLYFNGKVGFQGPNDMIADPEFINLSTDLAKANFKLKKTSPAVDQGSNLTGQYSALDILGTPRPQGGKPDRGAYEFVSENVSTGIATHFAKEKIILYPNPVKEKLKIGLSDHQTSPYRIEIFDIRGTSVKQQTIAPQTKELDVAALSAGLYLLVLYQKDEGAFVYKFVKQ
jgi:Secretion system C-terminal sorting domain/Right handed beta helix region